MAPKASAYVFVLDKQNPIIILCSDFLSQLLQVI